MPLLLWALAGRAARGVDFLEIKDKQERDACEVTITCIP